MPLTEVDIFHPIFKKGLDDAHYVERTSSNFNKKTCIDEELLLRFIKTTQRDKYDSFHNIYRDADKRIVERVVEVIDSESVLFAIKNEIEVEGTLFNLFYPKPEKRDWDTDAGKLYNQNIFSYIHELMYYKREEIDFAVFINGLPISSMELKLTTAASHFTYKDAIKQYQDRVNSSMVGGVINRYLDYKKGALFHIALDEKEAYVCTRLKVNNIYFLPFNKGNGLKGIEQGAGNPPQEGTELPTAYIWQNILSPDMLSDIVYNFMFYEDIYENDVKIGDVLILPRYHQLRVVNKVIDDIKLNKTKNNYLIQHSAGSGKSNSIVWLAHRLSSLRDDNGEAIFTSVIIVNDRKVVIKQLQENMKELDTLVLNELVCIKNDKSTKLAQAIDENKHIIITTVQAFLNAEKKLKEDSAGKRFAIIIDETHSSTEGRDIEELCNSLSKGGTDAITNKPENVSFIGFTATPKDTTLAKFGKYVGKTQDGKDKYEPFDNYSMKQAIEEGFIIDVLGSYIEVRAHCDVLKVSIDDPIVSKRLAKGILEKFIQRESVSVSDKVDIIMEHFINNVFGTLDDNAKAMIVCDGIAEVLEFRKAIKRYIDESTDDFVKDIKYLVAFSGEYEGKTENDYNELDEGVTIEKAVDSKEYQILIVANKFQTGYDQPKLSAMYINKSLTGVQAVQTLSRLNRPYHHPNEKNTYILDFVNNYADIKAAFSTYYQTTTLCTNVSKDVLVELYGIIMGLNLFNASYLADFVTLTKKVTPDSSDALKMVTMVNDCVNVISGKEENERKTILAHFSKYNRLYLLLRQIVNVPEEEYENLYRFLENVLNSFSGSRSGRRRSLVESLKKRVIITSDDITQNDVGTSEYEDNGEITTDVQGKTYAGTDGNDDEHLSIVVDELNEALGSNDSNNAIAKEIIRRLQVDAGLKVYARRNPYTDYADKFKASYDQTILDMMLKKEITPQQYRKFLSDDKKEKLSKATYNLFKD